MDTLIQVIVSGLTLGAMYAVGTIGLSLVWAALGMLNMAHGVLLAIGGYVSYALATLWGLPPVLGLLASIVAGAIMGAALYYASVRRLNRHPAFEMNVIIATFGLSVAGENAILKIFGGYPYAQPFKAEGGFRLSGVHVPWHNLLIVGVAAVIMLVIAMVLSRTYTGRAIRATAQDREAARLMGVRVGAVFAQVLAIGGALAGLSGVLLSSITTLSPQVGFDPMLKAFIICVIAGLGNVAGALYMAFALGFFEAVIQFVIGVRFALPLMLLLVIVALIWRPYGVFGREDVSRL